MKNNAKGKRGKAVLAYSGGLDTSVCLRLLQEKYSCEVTAVTVDVGIEKQELTAAAKKANRLGAAAYSIDAREEFANEFIFRAVKANASYEGYPLSTALARPLIAQKVVVVAKKERATALAHGATGKGNDQFRFETTFRLLAPEMRIIAPVRELNLTRKESMAYAKKHGIEVQATSSRPYSVDENLWGRSIEGGALEEPNFSPPEEIFETTKITKKQPEEVEIGFEKGEPVSLNSKSASPVRLIENASKIAGSHGVGRIDIMEDRVLGLKVREIYECPAAVMLLTAHKALEALVLTRSELKFKETVDAEWSELIYKGLWFAPLKEALECFIEKTQERVSGKVRVKLHSGSMIVTGRESKYALYEKKAASFDEKALESREVEGILKYHAMQGAHGI